MKVEQAQINKAFRALLRGDSTSWDQIVETLRSGKGITILYSSTSLTIRAIPPAWDLAQYLVALRVAADRPTLAEISDGVGVSRATLSRLFTGQISSGWPTVKVLVDYLGGDCDLARDLWQAARDQRDQ